MSSPPSNSTLTVTEGGDTAIEESSQSKYMMLDWRRFHLDCQRLSDAISEHLGGPSSIKGMVPIARGGLAPAALLAQQLNIRFTDTLCVQSYSESRERDRIELVKPVSPAVLESQGEGYLVVDDLADSGETLRFARNLLPKALFCTVYSKPAGISSVDIFVTEIPQDQWIVFPWETLFHEEDEHKVTML